MGLANYSLKRYGDAVRWLRETVLRLPNLYSFSVFGSRPPMPGWDKLEKAGKETAEVLRINPGFKIQNHQRILAYKDPKDVEHCIEGLWDDGSGRISLMLEPVN